MPFKAPDPVPFRTVTGLVERSKEPSPSCPASFVPQQRAWPLVRRAQEWV
jgi:hypothetical protein